MKLMSLFLAIIAATSVHAYDCKQNEAQFIGNVTELRIVNLGPGVRDCTFKISFTRFNESQVCPLDYSLATEAEFEDYLCSRKLTNGDEISGYLVEKNGFVRIDE